MTHRAQQQTGIVISTRILSPSSGWGKILVDTTDTPVIGNVVGIRPGDSIEWDGEVTRHPQYGAQIKAAWVRRVAPKNHKGQEVWLRKLPGVGHRRARLIAKLAEEKSVTVWEILEGDRPDISGVTDRLWESIRSAYADLAGGAESEARLMEMGIGGKLLEKVKGRWGHDAVHKVRENPYVLMTLPGVAWHTADKIALGISIPRDNPFRISAGIGEAARLSTEDGHTWSPTSVLVKKAGELLAVSEAKVREILPQSQIDGHIGVVGGKGQAALFPASGSERRIAEWVVGVIGDEG